MTPIPNADCYYRKKIRLRFCPNHSAYLPRHAAPTTPFRRPCPWSTPTASTTRLASSSKRNRSLPHHSALLHRKRPQATQHASPQAGIVGQRHHRTLFPSFAKMIFSSSRVTQMVAKHGRKKNYCSVCRVDYEDYLLVRPSPCSTSTTPITAKSSEPTSSASSSSRPRAR